MEVIAYTITNAATELLDESGVLARQSRLGEGVLLLDRQLRHAEAIEKLIEVLGPDALIEVAPGEFLRFSDTPAGMRARLEMMRLQRELDQMAAPVTPAAGAQPARNDGSDLIELIDQRGACRSDHERAEQGNAERNSDDAGEYESGSE